VGQGALAGDQANAQRRRACLVFFDDSALSLTPNVRRTWAPRGRPSTLVHPFNWKKASMAAGWCYGVRGGGAQLCFHVRAGNYDTDTLIEVLQELRKFLGGEKATLLWDGLPSHRSRAMSDWIRTQRDWLVVERLPASAPELDPVEACGPASRPSSWPTSPVRTLAEVIDQAHRGIERIRDTAAGLFVPTPCRPVGLMTITHPDRVKVTNPAAIGGTLPGGRRRSHGIVGDGVGGAGGAARHRTRPPS
jgi:hypothetical protein